MARPLTSKEAREMASLRQTLGNGPGRPRKSKRCPCGIMTLKRAQARGRGKEHQPNCDFAPIADLEKYSSETKTNASTASETRRASTNTAKPPKTYNISSILAISRQNQKRAKTKGSPK